MIDRLTGAGTLLVACDFDGTLAPIVSDPDAAEPLPRSVTALRRLASMADTTVAIISGRLHSELVERFGDDDFVLIGEHGSDAGDDDDGGDADTEPAELSEARRLVDEAAESTAGSQSEHKARSVAFHYRNAPDPAAAVARLRSQAAELPGIKVLDGKMVLEMSAAHDDKGTAVSRLKADLGSDRVLFIGDDVTDESVFAVLGPSDVGVKVGGGETLATQRVANPEAVADLLESLVVHRGS